VLPFRAHGAPTATAPSYRQIFYGEAPTGAPPERRYEIVQIVDGPTTLHIMTDEEGPKSVTVAAGDDGRLVTKGTWNTASVLAGFEGVS